jgi:hypothetical protein
MDRVNVILLTFAPAKVVASKETVKKLSETNPKPRKQSVLISLKSSRPERSFQIMVLQTINCYSEASCGTRESR